MISDHVPDDDQAGSYPFGSVPKNAVCDWSGRQTGRPDILAAMPTYQDLCDATASDRFRFADNAEGIVG
jgi:hypothetical protein